MNRLMNIAIWMIAFTISVVTINAQAQTATIIFVDSAAPTSGDGTSWDTAFSNLQNGLDAASALKPPVEIWVAAGTYTPSQRTNPNDPRTATFCLLSGVALYGGFPPGGGNGSFAARNPTSFVTTLSGDLDGNDDQFCEGEGGGIPGETCDQAGLIFPGETAFDTTNAITDGNVDCFAYEKDIWYKYVSPCEGRFIVNASFLNDPGTGFPIRFAIYRGICEDLILLGCSYSGAVHADVLAGETLYIRVGSRWSWDAGPGILTIGTYLKYHNAFHVITNGDTPVVGAVLDGFTISGGNSGGTAPDARGSGIRIISGSVQIENCTILKNSTYRTQVYLEDCQAELNNCTFSPGIYQGAAINITGSQHVAMNNCSFISIAGEPGYGQYAISAFSPITMNGCRVEGYSGGPGSAITINNQAEIRNCLIRLNQSALGGPVYVTQAGELVAINTRFEDNWTQYNSVGALVSTGKLQLIDCTISGNTAGTHTGAVMITGDGPNFISGCVFTQNVAEQGGGGALVNSSQNLIVVNSQFHGNSANGASASQGGGAIFNGGTMVIDNCTITNNQVPLLYGGLYTSSFGTTTLTNSILWGNQDSTENSVFAQLNQPQSSFFTYSCIQNYTGTGIGNISADPLFIDLDGPDGIPGTADDDLRLSSSSPCIDTGSNAALPPDTLDLDGDGDLLEPLSLDIAGNNRIINGTVDMGVYEFINALCSADCAPPGGNGTVNIDDLVAILNAWGTPGGACDIAPEDPTGGPAGDNIVNLLDLQSVLNAFGPCP